MLKKSLSLLRTTRAKLRDIAPTDLIHFYRALTGHVIHLNQDETFTSLGSSSASELPARPLRLLVWNIGKGQRKTFDSELREFAENCELFALQEKYLDARMMEVLGALSKFSYTGASSFVFSKIRTGVLTACICGAAKKNFIKSRATELLAKTPKISLFTYFPIQNREWPLLLINVHAVNFVSSKDYKEHLNEIFETASQHLGPLLIVGDFNCWSKSRFTFLQSLIVKFRLKEVSFDKYKQSTILGWAVDHVFYNEDIKITGAEVRRSAKGSDHLPLLVEFEII